jgi:hypothetical protein
MDNLKLCLSYLRFRQWRSADFQKSLAELYMAACQRFEECARQAGSFKDIEKAAEIKQLLTTGFYKETWVVYVFKRLAEFHPTFLHYFGESGAIREEIKKLILSLWDPLGVQLNISRHDDYDDVIRELEHLVLRFKYTEQEDGMSLRAKTERYLRDFPFGSPGLCQPDEIEPFVLGIIRLAQRLRSDTSDQQ